MPLTSDLYFDDDAELSAVAEKLATDIALETGVSDKIAEKIAWTALYKTVNEEDMEPGYPAEAGYQLSGNLNLASVTFRAGAENVENMPAVNYTYDDGAIDFYDFYFAGDTITLPTTEPTREGYSFKGWSVEVIPAENDADHLDADGADDAADETLLKAGDTYTITAGGVIFTAQWEKKTFTVKYYLPDETGAWVEKKMDTVDSVDYATYSLWTPNAEDGYEFSGWYQKIADIGVKAKVEKLYMAKEWKLYGKFTPIEYTIQYVYNDGKATSTNPTTYTVESDTITLADATGADWGKTFLEWHDENGQKIADAEADYTGTYRDIQWKNKTITELYYPGSVFKVITAAMGVDSGKATYYTTLNCSGAYSVAKQTYHCAGRKAHGAQNLAEALRNSCNIYFVQLGQRVGSSLFYDYFDAFGFTERTGVDLPNETSFMQYYSKSRLGEVELASSAFGQAMAVTPLQVCTAISAAVNGGYLVTPHVVDKITDQNGNVVQEIGTNTRRQVISESASETIRQIMEFEVGDGTQGGGGNAYVAGYRIGGKSGTSEQLNMDRRADGDYKKVASFAAVLPANDPEILVYVMLDDPNNARTDYSSILAAPVVGNIISEIAPYLGIATDGVDRSGTTVKVPNLTGKEWSNAQVQLNIKGLKHQLAESESDQTAALVTYQYPRAGAEVPYGTTVYLYTDTYEGKHAEVPDVTGKSADFARQMLNAAGLNCTVEGSGTVQSQSEAPGSSVQQGTIVHLICG